MVVIYFYILKDPMTGKIRYLGYTNNTKRRLYKHIYHARKNTYPNSHKDNWIRMLLGKGVEPILEVIDSIRNVRDEYVLKERRNWLGVWEQDMEGTPSYEKV